MPGSVGRKVGGIFEARNNKKAIFMLLRHLAI